MPGQPGAPGSSTPVPTPGDPGTPGQTPTPPSVPIEEVTCPTQVLAPTPLRRLTRYEYANVVDDLLGVGSDLAAGLPADEKVADGYSNNASILTVSPLHAEKYVLVSEEVAALAVQDIAALAPCAAGTDAVGPEQEACALAFIRDFGRLAFRRPLTPEDEALLLTAYDAGADGGSYQEGIEVIVRATLQSPHFLYRLETLPASDPNATMIPLGPYELATRLSFLIWGSAPDAELLDAAERGELGSKEQIAARARSMLADERARRGVIEFYEQWFGTSRLDIVSKDQSLFPAYSEAVRQGMAAELPAFMEHVLWSDAPTVETLLTSQVAFVNDALAAVYGVPAPAPDTIAMVTLPEAQGRAGVLTQAGFLSVQAHPDQTSPVLRGKTVRARLLCDPVPPPPDDVDISVPEIDPNATARERFSAHFDNDSCRSCHQLMDPIGFTFENFDAIGQYRETENDQLIDASGEIIVAEGRAGREELVGEFVGVRALADKLAHSQIVRNCVATEWFRFASGRKEVPDDGCSMRTLQESFAASGGNLIELVVGMTQTDAFLHRAPVVVEEVTQ